MNSSRTSILLMHLFVAAIIAAGCASSSSVKTPTNLSQTVAASKPAPAAPPAAATPAVAPTPAKAVPEAVAPVAKPAALLAPIPASAWKEEAYKWLGTPYLYGGSGRGGIDCSGLVQVLYRNVGGMPMPRTCQQQFQLGQPVHPADLKAGDLVFFRDNSEMASHVGVSLGGADFIHASARSGVIVSSLNETWYAEHVCGGKRIFP